MKQQTLPASRPSISRRVMPRITRPSLVLPRIISTHSPRRYLLEQASVPTLPAGPVNGPPHEREPARPSLGRFRLRRLGELALELARILGGVDRDAGNERGQLDAALGRAFPHPARQAVELDDLSGAVQRDFHRRDLGRGSAAATAAMTSRSNAARSCLRDLPPLAGALGGEPPCGELGAGPSGAPPLPLRPRRSGRASSSRIASRVNRYRRPSRPAPPSP